MFSLSMCTVAPRGKEKEEFQKLHYAAISLDLIVGVALLAIGIMASQWGFLPPDLQNILIGAGVAYTFGTLSVLGFMIKNAKAPDAYLIK